MRYKSWLNKPNKTKEELEIIAKQIQEIMNTNNDIIIDEKIEKITYDKNGNITINYEIKKHNLTKQINETAKILKIDNAKKIEELLSALSIEEN